MTLYLNEQVTPEELRRAGDSGAIAACKLYPAGATTNSEAGVARLDAVHPLFDAMQELDLPLLVHGEATDPGVDVFDRERVFLERDLAPLCERFPALRVVFEHITTADAARFVEGAREGVAATLTPQHLLLDRNDLFVGGLRPHHYCLPVLKRREHRDELRRVVASGSSPPSRPARPSSP
jgi:dihydroorotase